MSYLVGSTPTLLVALLLLVLVGSLPAVRAASGLVARLAPWLTVLTIVATAAAFWSALERPGTLPDTYPGRIIKYAAQELNASSEPNVLIIEGGSYVLNGVDCDDLMAELKELGHETKAIRVAAGAANHFERYRMLERVVERLSPRRPNQRWVLLAEVQQGYDTIPLTQFTENKKTSRTYDYSTPDNAWAAVNALRSPGVTAPPAWRWELFQSTMIHSFNVGALLRTNDEKDVVTGGGVVSRRADSRDKKFRGLDDQIELLSSPSEPNVLPWLGTIREPRLQRVGRSYLDELVYFGLPNTAPEQLSYVRSFCAGIKRTCIAPDATLLNGLNDSKLWRDKSHMSKKGATVYTRWLARQLVERGVVK